MISDLVAIMRIFVFNVFGFLTYAISGLIFYLIGYKSVIQFISNHFVVALDMALFLLFVMYVSYVLFDKVVLNIESASAAGIPVELILCSSIVAMNACIFSLGIISYALLARISIYIT